MPSPAPPVEQPLFARISGQLSALGPTSDEHRTRSRFRASSPKVREGCSSLEQHGRQGRESGAYFHVAANQLERLRSDTKPDANIDTASVDEMLGMLGGVTVLEALALELVLKARLLQSRITPPEMA